MPTLHIDKLRSGDGSEGDYKVVETTSLPRWGADAALGIVGRPYTRVEGVEKVTGRARYAYDMQLPGLLYARVLRTPLPHARIRRIDTSLQLIRRCGASSGRRRTSSVAGWLWMPNAMYGPRQPDERGGARMTGLLTTGGTRPGRRLRRALTVPRRRHRQPTCREGLP